MIRNNSEATIFCRFAWTYLNDCIVFNHRAMMAYFMGIIKIFRLTQSALYIQTHTHTQTSEL